MIRNSVTVRGDGVIVEQFNPNHDDRGEFASGPGSGGGGDRGTAGGKLVEPRGVRWDVYSRGPVAPAVKMNDGAIYAHPAGHYAALRLAFEQGYSPTDIVSFGEFNKRGAGKFKSVGHPEHYGLIRKEAWKDHNDERPYDRFRI